MLISLNPATNQATPTSQYESGAALPQPSDLGISTALSPNAIAPAPAQLGSAVTNQAQFSPAGGSQFFNVGSNPVQTFLASPYMPWVTAGAIGILLGYFWGKD